MEKTFTIQLPEPEVVDGKEVKELVCRQPLGGDIERVIGKPTGESITELTAAVCTNVALEPDDIRKFSGKNYIAIAGVMLDFLG
jgi:hypothetical protein